MDNFQRRTALIYLAHRVATQKCKRRWRVHPINSTRLSLGTFYTLYSKLKEDNEKFFNYFHMSVPSSEELLSKMKDGIAWQDTNMRLSIPPEEILAVTLRYVKI
jgi:hypothetical protein